MEYRETRFQTICADPKSRGLLHREAPRSAISPHSVLFGVVSENAGDCRDVFCEKLLFLYRNRKDVMLISCRETVLVEILFQGGSL